MAAKDETVLATFGQLNRDREFQIITRIVARGSQVSVRKEAYTNDAISHIDKLKINHKKLVSAVSSLNKIRAVEILGSGSNFVEFEYIKGRNVEYEAFKSILSNNYDDAFATIERIFALIDTLTSNRNNEESSEVKKINDIYHLPSSSAKYTSPGIIDLNLDNFILSTDDELVAFDCEWVFDQPIATDYIKTRLVYTFFARRSEAFAFLPNKTSAFNTIWEGDAQALIPSEIYTRYIKLLNKEAMRKYWEAEDIFQNSVNKHRVNTAESNYKNYKSERLTSSRLTFPEIEESRRNNYESLLADSRSNYESLLAHTRHVESELELIKSSATYKIALKIASAKGKIIKK